MNAINEKELDNERDGIEELLRFVYENSELTLELVELLEKLNTSGVLKTLVKIVSNLVPTDKTVLTSYLESDEAMNAIGKLVNVLPALSTALSSEKNRDLIKLILFNSEALSDALINGAKNPEPLGLMKMMSLMKDPELSRATTGFIHMLMALGSLLEKV